jgi:hypothetical protein
MHTCQIQWSPHPIPPLLLTLFSAPLFSNSWNSSCFLSFIAFINLRMMSWKCRKNKIELF